jgi:hypothetical protein
MSINNARSRARGYLTIEEQRGWDWTILLLLAAEEFGNAPILFLVRDI